MAGPLHITIVHHVFQGNWRDANTVPEVLRDLDERFGLKRIVFVGDRGMVTSRNLDDLRTRGHGDIVGRNRRRSGEVYDYIQLRDRTIDRMPCGHHCQRKEQSAQDAGPGGLSNEDGVRVFVVHSEERPGFESAQRKKYMERVRIKLAALEKRVAEGRLKSAEKIGAAAAAILVRNHGHRYFDWRLENGVFRFFDIRSTHPRAGVRGQIHHPNGGEKPVAARSRADLQGALGGPGVVKSPGAADSRFSKCRRSWLVLCKRDLVDWAGLAHCSHVSPAGLLASLRDQRKGCQHDAIRRGSGEHYLGTQRFVR